MMQVHNMFSFSLVILGFFFSPVLIALEENKPEITIPKILKTVTIDGKIEEHEWENAIIYDLVLETYPRENVRTDLKTRVYMMHDGSKLYVSFEAYHPDPSEIRSFIGDRDKPVDHDRVGIVINPFADGKLAYEFDVNALGIQIDYTISELTQQNYYEWDAIWDSAGVITDTGYIVEMSIPFNTMTLPNTKNQRWKIDLMRYHNDNAFRTIALNPWDKKNDCYVCQLKEMNINLDTNETKKSNIEITPSFVIKRDDYRNIGLSWTNGGNEYEPSLDVRWDISSEQQLYFTYQPDFSQVEADEALLDVNENFTLFIPEKRYFFLKNLNYFSTFRNLFHTRTIGAPEYGVNLTGKTEEHSYGIMLSRDSATTLIIPSDRGSSYGVHENEQSQSIKNNVAVGRYKYDYDERLTLGGFSSFRHADDYSNHVISIDGAYRATPSDRFRLQLIHSDSEYPLSIQDQYLQDEEMSGYAYIGEYEHKSDNWEGMLLYEDINEDFRADNGFIPRVGYDYFSGRLTCKWNNNIKSWWTIFSVGGGASIRHNEMGEVLGRSSYIFNELVATRQSRLRLTFGVDDYLYYDLAYNDHLYEQKYVSLYGNIKPTKYLSLWTNIRLGDRIDYSNNRLGDTDTISFGGTWSIGKHIQLQNSLRHEKMNIDQGEVFKALSIDSRFVYQIDVRSFLRLIYIDYDITRDLSLYISPDHFNADSQTRSRQLLYSYKLNPQTLFYIGYSDSSYLDSSTNSLFKNQRSLFLKFSYAFNL